MEASTQRFYLTKNNVRKDLHLRLDNIVTQLYKPYIGVILTQIESLGLGEKQEKAVKDMAKMSFYKNVSTIADSLLDTYFDVMHLLEETKVIDDTTKNSVRILGQGNSLPTITDRE